jgi:hypothetical protein
MSIKLKDIALQTLTAVLLASVTAIAVGQASSTLRTPTKIKFATGETTIVFDGDTDHVTVRDAQGTVMSESWCDSGSFDAYFTLFTKLKESAGRGDHAAVVKLAAYPLRINGKEPLTFRNAASLSKAYDKVFTPQVLGMIRKAEPAAVFCQNGQGMLGNGVVWASVLEGTAKVEVINR